MTRRPSRPRPGGSIVNLIPGPGVGGGFGPGMADEPEFHTLYDEAFIIRGKLRVEHARMRLTELHITAAADDAEVTATLLREVSLAELVQVAKGLVAREARFWTPEGQREAVEDAGGEARERVLSDDLVREARRRIKLASARQQRGAARGRGDAFYRRIAVDLVELVESGKPTPGGVLETLARIEAQRMHLSEVPVQTVRTWLRVAREKQFLAPGERGRLVALPGPLLYAEGGDR